MKITAPPPPRDSLILRVFRVLAVLFAAILGTTAANAQEAAMARVYKMPADTNILGASFSPRDTLVDIVSSILGGAASSANLPNFIIIAAPAGVGFTVLETPGGNGLPVREPNPDVPDPRDGTETRAGDLIIISDSAFGGNVRLTLRVYGNTPANLRLAEGDESLTVKTADDLVDGEEFFLTNNWVRTTVATSDTRGHVPAADVGGENPGGETETATGGDSNARDLAVIGLGVGVVGFMAAYLSGGDFSLFNFAPDFGYSLTESGYSVNTGGRLNFRKDNWHLYYAAGQANSNGEFGDFRYESGGKYAADSWTAAFSETVQGKTADYDFALSADYKGGIWKVSPTYRLHSHFANEEFDTQNSLNLRGELLWNRWTIRPSAGFRWESADEFGDNARFNLSAVRRF